MPPRRERGRRRRTLSLVSSIKLGRARRGKWCVGRADLLYRYREFRAAMTGIFPLDVLSSPRVVQGAASAVCRLDSCRRSLVSSEGRSLLVLLMMLSR